MFPLNDPQGIPGPTVQDSACLPLVRAAPLLEEARNVRHLARVTDLQYPLPSHRSGAAPRLSTHNHPVDHVQIEIPEWAKQGFKRQEPDGGVCLPEAVDAIQVPRILRVRGQGDERLRLETAGEHVFLPDRRLVDVALRGDFGDGNEATDTGHVAEEVVPGLDPLHRAALAVREAGGLRSDIHELLPGRAGEEVEPVGSRHRSPWWEQRDAWGKHQPGADRTRLPTDLQMCRLN